MDPSQQQPVQAPPAGAGIQPPVQQAVGQQIPQPEQAFPQPQYQQQPQVPVQPAPQPQQVAQPPRTKSNPNSTQNSLQIAEIRDGIVIMKDGSYRAVVLAQSINFDLMSPQEREGVESAYQGFLNSLYFNIQIVVRSRRVDLRSYLAKLQKVRENHENILLGLMMEDYIAYIDYLSQTANIMDKQFFLVVPFEPTAAQNITNKASKFSGIFNKKPVFVTINEEDFLKAKTELKNRVQAVLEAMNQMGVQAIPLNTQELIELYYDVYNPDTATSQPLTSYQDLEGAMVEKGQGVATRPDLREDNF